MPTLNDYAKKTVPAIGRYLISGTPKLKVGEVVRLSKGRRTLSFLAGHDGVFLFDPAEKPVFITKDALLESWKPKGKKWGTWAYATFDTLPLPDTMARRVLSMMRTGKLVRAHANYVRLISAITTTQYAWSKHVSKLMKEARKRYYEGNPILEDAEFDYLEDLVRQFDPKNPVLLQVGAKPTTREVKLPHPMPSLDKLKAGKDEAAAWVKKKGGGPLYVSVKIDGMSASVEYINGKLTTGYSRGNGEIGQLATAHVKAVPTIPKTIKLKGKVVVRGELVMPNSVFEAKYKQQFANPRNMVGGLINAKEARPALKDCVFYAHGLLGTKLTKQAANKILRANGFTLPPTVVIKNPGGGLDLTLSKRMAAWKKEVDMDMDGIVITIDNEKAAKQEGGSGNPEFSRAFKETTSTFRAIVGEVEWNESRYGLLKPRIRLQKGVKHAGVTITYATAHNAAYVRDNRIGPGAIIEMSRSGDVIPYIVRVIKKAKAQLPKGKWEWTASGVDIVAKGAASDEQILQRLTHFFASLGVDYVGYGIVSKLHAAGHTSVPEILALQPADIEEIEGFQKVSAKKVYDSIHGALSSITLPQLAYASTVFDRGIGREKFALLYREYGDEMFDWKSWSLEDVVEEVATIPGFGVKSARQFVAGIRPFIAFYRSVKKWITFKKPEKAKSAKLAGTNVVFTGFRDAQMEARLTTNGGKVSNSISKDTTFLVTKTLDSTSSKAVKAKALGVKVLSRVAFENWLSKKGV